MKSLVVLTASSLLLGSLSLAGAQATQKASQSMTQVQYDGFGRDFRPGFGPGFGPGRGYRDGDFGGLPFGHHLALGTTVTLEFYNADPSAANSTAEPTQTLNFTYGQDSEAAFAQSFTEARANASYLTVNVGEQTQTLELPGDTSDDTLNLGKGNRRGGTYGAFYGALPLGNLNEGSSVTATFYDGDPEANGQELQTLNFTYGQDSEVGFADEFASAAQNAAYVTVTISPQTYTVNLSAVPNGFMERGPFGDDGFRGGFGRRR